MKKPILFFFLFLISTLQAQNLSVQSFKVLENDMDARVHQPVKDQNGDLAALIKVVNTNSGFDFDIGSLGVVKTVQKTGEIWVYVPEKAQRITIQHKQLGVLRNYTFPIAIEKAKVYELVLVSGKIETIVKETEIETQWVAINTSPEGANVFLNERLVGKTPYSGQFPLGTYSYKIELPKHYTEAGSIVLKNAKVVLNPVLKPKYGTVKISTSPESGMEIYLDNENTGKKSPAELKEISSGEHSIKIISEWYAPQSKKVVVEDGKTLQVDFKLEPEFATINIKSNPQATIFINGVRKASGSFNGRLLSGVYTLKIEADKHYPHEQQLVVKPGQNQNLTHELKAITGNLAITSTPFGATILLNGKNYGTTPETIKNLPIGEYSLQLTKEGYSVFNELVIVSENKTENLNVTINQGLRVKIQSSPSNSFVYINNELVGITPLEHNLIPNTYYIKVVNKEKYADELIEVSFNSDNIFDFELCKCNKVFNISTSPYETSEVIINGKYAGYTPLEFKMCDNSNRVKIKNSLYKTKSYKLSCQDKETQTIKIEKKSKYTNKKHDLFTLGFPIIVGLSGISSTIDTTHNLQRSFSYGGGFHINYRPTRGISIKNELSLFINKFSNDISDINLVLFRYNPSMLFFFNREVGKNSPYFEIGYIVSSKFNEDLINNLSIFNDNNSGYKIGIGIAKFESWSIGLNYIRNLKSPMINSSKFKNEITISYSFLF